MAYQLGQGNCTACHPSQRAGLRAATRCSPISPSTTSACRATGISRPILPGAVESHRAARRSTTRARAECDVPVDAEYAYYDLGLCGPFEPAPAMRTRGRTCSRRRRRCAGVFKVPTLRNIAITSPYFHNGVFSDPASGGASGMSRAISTTTPATTRTRCLPAPAEIPIWPVGTFLPDRIGYARPLRVQRSAGRVRRQRQRRRGALHAAHLRRRPGADAHGRGDRRHRGVPLHAHRRLRSHPIRPPTTSRAVPADRLEHHTRNSADEHSPTPDSKFGARRGARRTSRRIASVFWRRGARGPAAERAAADRSSEAPARGGADAAQGACRSKSAVAGARASARATDGAIEGPPGDDSGRRRRDTRARRRDTRARRLESRAPRIQPRSACVESGSRWDSRPRQRRLAVRRAEALGLRRGLLHPSDAR